MSEKQQTEPEINDKQKEILLKILGIQNEAIESGMESVNTYLREIYAHNVSLTHIISQNLKS